MSKYFLITLNWEVLRRNMAREQKKKVSDPEIKKWLKEAGFNPKGEQWLVKEADLGVLDPSEVSACDPADPPQE